jgi:hypothetical protein
LLSLHQQGKASKQASENIYKISYHFQLAASTEKLNLFQREKSSNYQRSKSNELSRSMIAEIIVIETAPAYLYPFALILFVCGFGGGCDKKGFEIFY